MPACTRSRRSRTSTSARSLPADTLRRRVNDELPADINILSAEPVPHRFHARHDAVARRYLYQIARRRTAFAKAFVWWVKEPLDVDRMRAAARPFVGMRDFQSFAAGRARRREKSTPRARGSPRRSCRTAISCSSASKDRTSSGRWSAASSACSSRSGAAGSSRRPRRRFSASRRPRPARLTAPPSGLFLERVYYRGDAREPRACRAHCAVPSHRSAVTR